MRLLTKKGRAASDQKKRKRAATELAVWMKLLLECRGMSISELARRTGRDRADVSKSLTGRHVWEFDRIKDYAAALLLDPKDIVTVGTTHEEAFGAIYRPMVDWALTRPTDHGPSISPWMFEKLETPGCRTTC